MRKIWTNLEKISMNFHASIREILEQFFKIFYFKKKLRKLDGKFGKILRNILKYWKEILLTLRISFAKIEIGYFCWKVLQKFCLNCEEILEKLWGKLEYD